MRTRGGTTLLPGGSLDDLTVKCVKHRTTPEPEGKPALGLPDMKMEWGHPPMRPVERVIRTLDSKPFDRALIFSAMVKDRTFSEVLGKPLVPLEWLMTNTVSRRLFDRRGDSF